MPIVKTDKDLGTICIETIDEVENYKKLSEVRSDALELEIKRLGYLADDRKVRLDILEERLEKLTNRVEQLETKIFNLISASIAINLIILIIILLLHV